MPDKIKHLLVAILLLIPMLGLAAPAQAHDTPLPNCPETWSSEDQLIHLPIRSPQTGNDCWRPVIWGGTGNLLGRQDLYRHAGGFASRGFSRNFLWYAEQTTIRVADYANQSWAGCNHLPVSVGSFCTSINQSNVGHDFVLSADPRLTVLKHADDWIALACGNFLIGGGAPDKPVPTISARKYHDLNADGNRSPNEPYLPNWPFRLVQETSVDPTHGPSAPVTRSTDGSGTVTFALDGLSPGRYRVEELTQTSWVNTGATSQIVDVGEGIGNASLFAGEFGNTRLADPQKAAFELVSPPTQLEVLTDTELTVRSTIRNNGPGGPVDIRETLMVGGPQDCLIAVDPKSRIVRLNAGQSAVVDAKVTVNCTLPSNHTFGFSNEVELAGDGAVEADPSNNTAQFDWTAPVFADADLSVSDVGVDCPAATDVGATFQCTVAGVVTNEGPYGPVDVAANLDLTGPGDCDLTPLSGPSRGLGMVEAGQDVPVSRSFDIVCRARSYHDFAGVVGAEATDQHVRDAAGNNTGTASDRVEVFQAADLRITDVHTECDEVVGAGDFICRADVDFVNLGPADDVHTVVFVDLSRSDACTATPGRHQESGTFLLGAEDPQRIQFFWSVSCPASAVLHPFEATTDIFVDLGADPHAVDEPGPQSDIHIVPTCLETVNPHGKQIPQAPGQGQNEDGFYEISSLPGSENQEVFVRDTATGTTFGPFEPGTRVKYVEANGAKPSIKPMAANGSNNNGSATAVDWQIKGQGDMQIVVVDEDGGEVTTTCLVPPFPK